MAKQETLVARKRRGPTPTGKGQQIVVRMQPDLLDALDAWIAGQPEPQPTRAEAIRGLIRAAILTTADIVPSRNPDAAEPRARAVADYWEGEQERVQEEEKRNVRRRSTAPRRREVKKGS